MKQYIKILTTILIALLFPAAVFAQTWVGPTATPPGNNVATPINTSSTAQSKIGGLLLNTGNATNGLIVQYGNVGIGTTNPGYKLQVGTSGDGTSVAANAYFYISDESLKTNILPLTDSLSKILDLQGVSFDWKSNGEPSIGLIAQDVNKVYPQLVNTDPSTGLESVEYGNLVAPLIEAIKEQQAEIVDLQNQVKSLEAKDQ